MTVIASSKDKFEQLRACVIIPTYNNRATLERVIREVSEFTDHIIVVNDGSTDDTKEIIGSFPFVQSLGWTENKGKGWALRSAFAFALQKGYKYAITIDSDGQHFAKDLPGFIEKLAVNKHAIIVGARNMNQSSIPSGSSSGNRISNFWFKLETGIDCTDTQSGYRLYPLKAFKTMHFFTGKYEFETEILVRAAWKRVDVLSVPITVFYAPPEERISHFRPYKDFARISVMNAILVIIAFVYIKPRNFFHSLFIKKNFRQKLYQHLFNTNDSDEVKACSVAFGIFMGIIPLWGFQLVLAISLALLLRLNKPLVIIAANISIPPMIPIIIFLSYKAGAFWMGDDVMHLAFSRSVSLSSVKNNLQQYIYGSITLAVISAIGSGLLTFFLLKFIHRKSVLAG